MKKNQILLFAALSLSVAFTACEKQEIIPSSTEQPTTDGGTGNPNTGNGGSTPGSGTGTTPPPPAGPVANPNPQSGALLTQWDVVKWGYDEQKRFASYDSYHSNDAYTVVYEGDRAVRLNYETGHYLLYTWEQDKVVSAKVYWQDMEIRHYRFEYSGTKLTKKVDCSWYPDYTRGWLVVSDYRYDERGNLIEIATAAVQSNKEEELGARSYIRWGGYDNHPNPMIYAESDIYLPGVKLFENNPGYRQTGYKELYTYTYHESGLPRERHNRVEGYEHVPAVVSTYLYK